MINKNVCEVVLVSQRLGKKKRAGDGGNATAIVDLVGRRGWAEGGGQDRRARGAGEAAFEQRPEPSEETGAAQMPGEERRRHGAQVLRPHSSQELVRSL